jgi:hypothetical protein
VVSLLDKNFSKFAPPPIIFTALVSDDTLIVERSISNGILSYLCLPLINSLTENVILSSIIFLFPHSVIEIRNVAVLVVSSYPTS